MIFLDSALGSLRGLSTGRLLIVWSVGLLGLPCPSSGASGIIDRANEQYFNRDYSGAGLESADAARENFERAFMRDFKISREFARARYLQATHFLSVAQHSKKKEYLHEGIGQAMQGALHFERTYGRNVWSNARITSRDKKIYADLLYWKGAVTTEWVKDQGGGFENELSLVAKDMRALISNGYGCINAGGPFRILGQHFEAYQCTRKKTSAVSWSGTNTLNYAKSLLSSGRQKEGMDLLKEFISTPLDVLAIDLIPENLKAQKEAAQLVGAHSTAPQGEVIPGEFVVLLKNKNLTSRQVQSLPLGGVIKEFLREDLVLIQRPLIELSSSALSALQKNPHVEVVEPNFVIRLNGAPNDPEFSKLWGLLNMGQEDSKGNKGVFGADIAVTRAWDLTTGDESMIVGVIDTGIDYSSPDLRPNAWVNWPEARGTPGVDDDGNGYIDDINGYDFLNNTGLVVDDHGHGTHVAAIIGARGNNGFGVVGVNWKIQLMSLKFLGSNGAGNLVAAVKAIHYATKMGARITNNSWGSGDDSIILKSAIQEAADAGALFVAAAGNSGENADLFPQFPSGFNLPNIISVASINNRGQLSNFSNYGSQSVHLGAPGENILSLIPGGIISWSGTSMATPHVSGVAALLWGYEPSLSLPQLKARILSSTSPLRGLRSKTRSGGAVNAYAALTGIAPPADPNDPGGWAAKEHALSTPHNYLHNTRETHRLSFHSAKAVSLHFKKFDLELGYDQIYFTDKSGRLLGIWTGVHDLEFSPVAEGDTIFLHFVSDNDVAQYGFDIDKIAYK